MANQPPPSSQKAGERPIEFVLDDQATGRPTETVSLVIRPEDFTRAEPSRLTTQQTLGGAWVDNFGPGLANIVISGITGWRRSNDGRDGLENFQRLNDVVFRQWHRRREEAIEAGIDPAGVKLIYADSLDRFAWEVAPVNFSLKRNKNRPLLLQYQINLIVISQSVSQHQYLRDPDHTEEESRDLGLDSLQQTLLNLNNWSEEVADMVVGVLGTPVSAFLDVTKDTLDTVQTVVSGITGVVDNVVGAFLSIAADLMAAARNIFWSTTQMAGLPDYTKFRCQQVAAAYNNAFCLLKNAFEARRFFPDYGWLYGASTCSSTTFGSPLAPFRNSNPFERLTPITGTQTYISVDQGADTSISAMGNADPALFPPSAGTLANNVRRIASGVTLREQ